mgnify:CR=1 FL=1
MLRRLFLCLVLLPLLSACVLESAEPLIADKDGVLALAGFGAIMINYFVVNMFATGLHSYSGLK